ncbi:MAG TPA: hypothetical protein VD763_11575, partial [Candidatus Saccharimonadales bacterium]|nr:hypothetical protein [Candidatus Saccharimonadales bacterium]
MTDPRRPMDLTCEDVRDFAASYVLDALEPDEMDAVRAHLVGHSDAHPEIEQLASVLPVLHESVPVMEPSAELKTRIMAAAAADLQARGSTGTITAAPTSEPSASDAAPTPFPSAAERSSRAADRSTTSAGTWLLRIAAVLAIALLGGWNLLLQGQLNEA